MQTAKLKIYAPKARRDFIAAVTRRAATFGLSAKGASPNREEGQLVFIEGRAYPRSVGAQRQKLAARIEQQGFQAVMEAVAYTWFNRFAAIRFMELHGYLDHSFRVLSHPAGGVLPEILEHAQHVELPGLDRARVLDLKLDGTRDEELYRNLLLAQCRALHRAMPFLFERIDDETELLLPDHFLQTDSLIRELVTAIPEADWQEVEIIGWLYQFYISEKKDQVIGKVVKSEDIPAATQLFTPNWIVKYMVQNALGAQWLATYPDSPLKGQMVYYIEPAEQTEEVKAQLAAITPDSLDPEALTLMDPACGSGHILVEAYDLFKAIYLERGYRLRDIPRLILEKNLYGLDIDERAAQLAGFVLMMKAREDDRRLFERGVTLNVMALQESRGLVASDEWRVVSEDGVDLLATHHSALSTLLETFAEAKTFGSLIQVPEALAVKLPKLRRLCEVESQDLFVAEALGRLRPLVRQAELLARRYDAVVANPPYMGSKGMNSLVKAFTGDNFPDAKSDLFACFMERGHRLAKDSCYTALVTMQSWMFLSSFEKIRERILREKTIYTMAHLGSRAFGSISGEVVQTTAFVSRNSTLEHHKPVFFRLLDGGEEIKKAALARQEHRYDRSNQRDFTKIPGSPIAYWVSDSMRSSFRAHRNLSEIAKPKQGLATTDNDRFLRRWWECSLSTLKFDAECARDVSFSRAKWFPCQKGGGFRKWFGNNEYVVNWADNGREIKDVVVKRYGSASKRVVNEHLYFTQGTTWSSLSSAFLAMRYVPPGYIFETKGSMCFFRTERELFQGLGFCNSCVVNPMIQCVSPTLDFHEGPVGKLPIATTVISAALDNARDAVRIASCDWSTYERSWDFRSFSILTALSESTLKLKPSYTTWIMKSRDTIAEMKRLEEENNRLFIDAYGLQDELTPEVPIDQITLTVNPAYRYGKKLTDDEWSVEEGFPEELETRFREDTMQELVSYAIGCAMGRYRLDEPGLIYAHSGNQGFDPSRYTRFPADTDGILPITDTDWFDDDAAHRLVEFIAVAWPEEVTSGEWRVKKAPMSSRIVTSHQPLDSSLITRHSPLICAGSQRASAQNAVKPPKTPSAATSASASSRIISRLTSAVPSTGASLVAS